MDAGFSRLVEGGETKFPPVTSPRRIRQQQQQRHERWNGSPPGGSLDRHDQNSWRGGKKVGGSWGSSKKDESWNVKSWGGRGQLVSPTKKMGSVATSSRWVKTEEEDSWRRKDDNSDTLPAPRYAWKDKGTNLEKKEHGESEPEWADAMPTEKVPMTAGDIEAERQQMQAKWRKEMERKAKERHEASIIEPVEEVDDDEIESWKREQEEEEAHERKAPSMPPAPKPTQPMPQKGEQVNLSALFGHAKISEPAEKPSSKPGVPGNTSNPGDALLAMLTGNGKAQNPVPGMQPPMASQQARPAVHAPIDMRSVPGMQPQNTNGMPRPMPPGFGPPPGPGMHQPLGPGMHPPPGPGMHPPPGHMMPPGPPPGMVPMPVQGMPPRSMPHGYGPPGGGHPSQMMGSPHRPPPHMMPNPQQQQDAFVAQLVASNRGVAPQAGHQVNVNALFGQPQGPPAQQQQQQGQKPPPQGETLAQRLAHQLAAEKSQAQGNKPSYTPQQMQRLNIAGAGQRPGM